ncbi:class II glutamine amidotransferase [Planctobacterium marinum]|uniref:class II glutamine amidotransferase n=1 Tax=Planctobacterium marinum TaxID=1631968 RepID=UPI001E2BB44E|nr:class II glutamine amidotransferase [Planctobacterium marinum]MCC2604173.1 class II glutamine amidotransferase [Planctobacterium marinum]
MCELLGMSANVPTDICFSFCGLLERGGRTGPHRDGWGITFYEGKGCRSFKDPLPSCDSEIAKLVKSYPIKSCSVISHIRQANRGKVSLENTHPFIREMWGRHWTYAHNGQLSNYKDKLQSDIFQPVGNTDSEMAFCWIMDNIKKKYPNRPKDMKPVFRYVAKLAASLRELGVFNMLLSDGIYLMTYCTTKLHWITRRAPFGKATLIDTDWVIDFQQETTPNDVVSVIATEPLTGDETWQNMTQGEYVLFKKGEPILKGVK